MKTPNHSVIASCYYQKCERRRVRRRSPYLDFSGCNLREPVVEDSSTAHRKIVHVFKIAASNSRPI
jgi:hypothetical protein